MDRYFKVVFLFLLVYSNCFPSTKTLTVYNWPSYMDKQVLTLFAAKTGARIEYVLYNNNEEVKDILVNKNADIVFPSLDYIHLFSRLNLLSKIDTSKIKDYKHIKKEFFQDNDKKPRYVDYLPYFWGSTGIIHNKSSGIVVKKWSDLWQKGLKDKILILNDMGHMFEASFKSLNIPLNTNKDEDIKKAYEHLLDLIPNVKNWANSSTLEIDFVNSNIVTAIESNGNALSLIKKLALKKHKDKIEYVYPKEGVVKWLDGACIPKGSKNKDLAHQFISFVLSDKMSLMNANKIGYATTNFKAYDMMEKKIRNNAAIYPSDTQLKNTNFNGADKSKHDVYQKYWNDFVEKVNIKVGK